MSDKVLLINRETHTLISIEDTDMSSGVFQIKEQPLQLSVDVAVYLMAGSLAAVWDTQNPRVMAVAKATQSVEGLAQALGISIDPGVDPVEISAINDQLKTAIPDALGALGIDFNEALTG